MVRVRVQRCPIAFFSNDDERVIGGVYCVRPTDSFGSADCSAYVVLARDKLGRYQGFGNFGMFATARAAERVLVARLVALESQPTPEVPMRPDTLKGVDLFAPVRGATLNAKFVALRDNRNSSAAWASRRPHRKRNQNPILSIHLRSNVTGKPSP